MARLSAERTWLRTFIQTINCLRLGRSGGRGVVYVLAIRSAFRQWNTPVLLARRRHGSNILARAYGIFIREQARWLQRCGRASRRVTTCTRAAPMSAPTRTPTCASSCIATRTAANNASWNANMVTSTSRARSHLVININGQLVERNDFAKAVREEGGID